MEILGGPIFGVAGAGESHGPGVTTIVFGCPAGIWLERDYVQSYLDRRRPGGNRHGTPRNEKDKVVFLSGIFDDQPDNQLLAGPEVTVKVDEQTYEAATYQEGYTTGEPLAAVVLSVSNKSRHYEQFAGEQGEVRPGHTDLVKHYQSQGYVDYRGGGRSSYRSTISDVIGGSVARMVLHHYFGTVIFSSISQVGEVKATRSLADQLAAWEEQFEGEAVPVEETTGLQEQLDAAEIATIDGQFAKTAAELIKKTRIAGDSIGAQVEVAAVNVPALVGEPLYQSLKMRLMGALGGLHAAEACEIGAGTAVVSRRGSENNDPIRQTGYQSNNHGGLLGGITTGSPLVARVSFKPTSTIQRPQRSVRKNLEEIDFELQKGRHDPCVGVRAGVTLESRLAIELLNAVLYHQSGEIDPAAFNLFSKRQD